MSETNKTNKKKIGLVLGSGGIKCFAAISILKFLKKNNIPIDLVVGCSGGSIVATMWGAGYSPEQIEENVSKLINKDLFKKVNYRSILSVLNFPYGKFDKTSGFYNPSRLQKLYHSFYNDLKLEDLNPKIVLQTYDYVKRKGLILEEGLVADAVYASGASYPIFPPIKINNKLLIDGACASPLPVLEAVNRNMDVIIAVSFYEEPDPEPNGFLNALFHHTRGIFYNLTKSQTAFAIDIHHHEIILIRITFDRMIKLWEIKELPYILKTGEKIIEQKKEEIFNAINS